jgi:hypothetical protein
MVGVFHRHTNLLAEGERREFLLRPGAVGLAAFWSIDAIEAHPHLPALRGQQGQGIAILNANDLAQEVGGESGRCGEQQGGQQQAAEAHQHGWSIAVALPVTETVV